MSRQTTYEFNASRFTAWCKRMTKKKARLVIAIGIHQDGTYYVMAGAEAKEGQVEKVLRDMSIQVQRQKPDTL